MIMVGGDPAVLAKMFNDIQVAGRINSPYAMPSETNIPIYVLRSPRVSLGGIWSVLKHYE